MIISPSSRLAHRASRVSTYLPSILICLTLSVLPVLFFWRLFAWRASDRMWLPDGDLTQQYFPLRVIAAGEIAAGRLPLWNAHMFAGQPGLADSQMAALYPVNLLTALALGWLNRPFTLAVFQWQIVLHYALAALFTFAFALRLTRSRFGAWVAALTFTFGGYLISYPAQQPAILEGAVWLPLVLLLLDWASDQVSVRRLIPAMTLAGAAMAMSMLAGHPQTFIYVFYTSLAYWLYRAAAGERRSARDGRRWTRLIVRLSYFVIFLAVAVGLSAVQLLPSLEFTRLSTRAQPDYAFTSAGFAPYEIITLLVPGYFGGSPLYVGIIPLLLAGAALFGRRRSDDRGQRRTAVPFLVLLALVALLLSFGDSSFVYSLFYLLAPVFALIRDQERAALLWSFALAVLAAIGAAGLAGGMADGEPQMAIGRPSSVVPGVLLLVLLVLIAAAYIGALASEAARVQVNLFPGALRQLVPDFFIVLGAWALWRADTQRPRARAWVGLGLLGLIALQLFSVNGGYQFQQPTPPDYFPDTPLTQALHAELAAHPAARVSSEGLLPGAHNAGAEYGFEDIGGNDPLALQSFADFSAQVSEPRRYALLDVGYVVTRRALAPELFVPIASAGDLHLYRLAQPFARAWLVHDVRVVPAEQTLAALNAPDFDPSSSAVLDAAPPAPLPAAGTAGDVVNVAQHAPGRLSLRTRSPAASVLVVSEVFYPGWKVSVDGQPATMLPADGVLMAVPLPGGDHAVELTFDPDLVKIGAVVSVLSVLWCVGIGLWADRHHDGTSGLGGQ